MAVGCTQGHIYRLFSHTGCDCGKKIAFTKTDNFSANPLVG